MWGFKIPTGINIICKKIIGQILIIDQPVCLIDIPDYAICTEKKN